MSYSLNKKLSSSFRLTSFQGYLTVLANMASSSINSINYEQLKEYMKKNAAYIIDVRERQEILDSGKLPNSVNIPVAEMEKALRLSGDEFVRQYDADKPKIDTELIFSCRSGRRSEMAAQTAVKLGFKKVMNYSGGWLDWEQNEGKN